MNRGQQNKYEQQARKLYFQGNYQQAATLFRRLADKPSARQNVYRLQAAQTLLKLEDFNKAKVYLDLISSSELNNELLNQLHLLYAQLYLSAGNADQAINRLQLISFASLSKRQKRSYYELSAHAYASTGQLLESVQQRMALDAYLEQAHKNENRIAIIEELSLLPLDTLEDQLYSQQNDIYSGWLEMAMIASQYPKGTPNFITNINAWEQQYPRHPGHELINSGYFVPSGIVLSDIKDVAVFLPESGPYSPYAKAIKEGILAVYRRQEQDAKQPEIQFYDTRSTAIVSLYRQVVAQGAQLVIGPLEKKFIIELTEKTDLTVPVLALNYVEGLIKDNLYQFALSPIDEVQQVVQQARSEGYINAIILTPETAEGERIRGYFQNAWESSDGNILAVQTFSPGIKDFSLPVKQLLNIQESQHRFENLNKTVGYFEYHPRRRQDVDVIFIVAGSSVARLINPQFYHNRAQSVAVYGLSRVYAGRPKSKQDLDLEGISFCSIPWLFEEAYQGELDKLTLQEVWQATPDRFLSLIAFGIDAYALLPYLNEMALEPFHGATGDLSLNEYNRIERQLVCAKFKKGNALLKETENDFDEDQ